MASSPLPPPQRKFCNKMVQAKLKSSFFGPELPVFCGFFLQQKWGVPSPPSVVQNGGWCGNNPILGKRPKLPAQICSKRITLSFIEYECQSLPGEDSLINIFYRHTLFKLTPAPSIFVPLIATTTYSLFLSYVPEPEVILSDLDQYQ